MGKYLLDLKKKKTVYLFDSKDKTFSKISKTRIDPETSLTRGEDVFFSFQNSTEIPPPECEYDECAVFSQYLGKWEVKPDIRNKVFWNKRTLEKYEPKKFDEEVSGDFTDIEPPSPYHTWNFENGGYEYTEIERHIDIKVSTIQEGLILKKSEPFTHDGREWSPIELQRINYQTLIISALLCKHSENPETDWIPVKIYDINNEAVDFGLDSFISLCRTITKKFVEIDRSIDGIRQALIGIKDDTALSLEEKYNSIEEYQVTA